MIAIRNLGNSRDYSEIFHKMQEFTNNRNETTPDELWFLEHNHVFTQGKAGKPEHVLNPGNVPIIQTDRGGQITYHGPGQMVIYALLDLRRKKLGVKQFVHLLEQTIIDTLETFAITANSREDAPGIYVNGAKICSLGLRIHRGCTYHGLAFNINTDLQYFARINPCGYKNLAMCNVADFVEDIKFPDIEIKIKENFLRNFDY